LRISTHSPPARDAKNVSKQRDQQREVDVPTYLPRQSAPLMTVYCYRRQCVGGCVDWNRYPDNAQPA
jgi:hypothetical protein